MAEHRLLTVAGLLTVLTLTVGCASGRAATINQRLTERLTSRQAETLKQRKQPDATYVVDPPDVIKVEFLNESGLTRDVELRSDGCVTLPLVDDVEVAGLTTAQIRDKLQEKYAQFYKEVQILVTVTAYRSKHIYVYGEVGRQGSLAYTGSQMVSDAIGAVGGVSKFAATGRVRVVRGALDEAVVYKVDLDKLIFEGDATQDVSLAENDVVYVPPTTLAWIGYQIDAVLFPFRGLLSALTTARAVGIETVPGR